MLPSVVRILTPTNWKGAKFFELKKGEVKKKIQNSGKIKAAKKKKNERPENILCSTINHVEMNIHK